jgi:hypothetical protein
LLWSRILAIRHLTADEWCRVTAAIPKRRQRWNKPDARVSIDISAEAREMLAEVAQQRGGSYTEALVSLCQKALARAR